jgi:hypothetical protein
MHWFMMVAIYVATAPPPALGTVTFVVPPARYQTETSCQTDSAILKERWPLITAMCWPEDVLKSYKP